MPFSLIAAILVVFLAVAFSLQNADPVSIVFFGWTFQGSLVLILLTTLVLGMLITFLASMPSRIKQNRTIAQQQKTIDELQRSFSQKTESAQTASE